MTYIVQPGDSLYSIVLKLNTTIDAIASLNKITNPELIYPGKILNIPTRNPIPDECFTYIVQPGDSLYLIALRYNVSLGDLISVNVIDAPYIIYPGQTIIIPSLPCPTPPEGSQIYIVQPGDSIYSIAGQYNVDFEEIIRLNSIPQPDLIYLGQRLIIPPASL